MKKRLLNLLAQKKDVVDKMKAADQANDQAAFDTAKAELEPLDAEIARVKAIMDAEENEPVPVDPKPENSHDCIHAFCECIRAQASGDRIRFDENINTVRRAVKNEGGMNETTPAEGGLVVPQDIQTKINELRRTLNPLSALFNIENVSFISGSRVIDTAPTAGFAKVAEFGVISQDDKPSFRKIDYTVEKYALIVPISNELLKDSDQNLIAYLSRWFAKKGVITENKLLLTLLSPLNAAAETAAAGKELAAIKKALNVNLDPAISISSSFVTNQDGFNYLDTLEDKQGRPLLQPNPVSGTSKMLLSRSVHVMSNAVLPSTDGAAPLYIGDFKQYGTMFRRKALEIASTNIGGNSWNTDSTEVRGIMRLGAETYDTEAATAVTLTLPA